ncbi:MAG: hypothetical protein NVSMB30_07040 [Hymenobacter sp.]
MNNKLEELIKQGDRFDFQNNLIHQTHGTFCNPSDELLAWIANIEHYLIENYDENSGPFNLFRTFKMSQISGNYQNEFDKQLTILRGTLISCRQIPFNKKTSSKDDNLILRLIKNPAFWTVTVILMGGSFSLGSYFSSSKFDKEKNELYDENRGLKFKIRAKIEELSKQETALKNVTERLDFLEKKTQKR